MEAEILAGMDLLDERFPGWEDKVNLDRLDQYESKWTDGCGCVLVHVFGDYHDGLDELRVFKHDARKFGFILGSKSITIGGVTTAQGVHRRYKVLTSEWKKLFSARYGEVVDGS